MVLVLGGMMDPVYVTNTRLRKLDYPWRMVFLPISEERPNDFDEQMLWEKKYRGRLNYSVHKDNKKEAISLARRLECIDEASAEGVKILARLEEIRVKKPATPAENWARSAVQMPEDWGPSNNDIAGLKKFVSSLAMGHALEAMCGFNSYFDESVADVTAIDFCTEALELYEHPERPRILYDFERVCKGEQINFFPRGFFGTIGLFFAAGYVSDSLALYSERSE